MCLPDDSSFVRMIGYHKECYGLRGKIDENPGAVIEFYESWFIPELRFY